MPDQIHPMRFKQAMSKKGLNAKSLLQRAKAAGLKLSPRSIARFRSASQKDKGGVRPETVEILARILDIEPGYLLGIGPDDESVPAFMRMTRWTLEVPTAVRNNYELLALDLGMPVSTVLQLGGPSFKLVVEESLSSRSASLREMRAAAEALSALGKAPSHLPPDAHGSPWDEDIYMAEERSIAERDVFGEKVTDANSSIADRYRDDFDEDRDNALAAYIRRRFQALNIPAKVECVSRHFAEYSICSDVALKLAGGDQDLAEDILDGSIPLYEMPRNLLTRGAGPARIEWLKAKAEAHRAQIRKEFPLDDIVIPEPDARQGES